MEQVEEATKEAVASCHRVLNLLSQQQHDQIQHRRVNLAAEAGEAVSKFKTVISLLNNSNNNNNNSNAGLGHARVRKHKRLPILLPHSILLDSPNCHVSAKASSHSLHHHDAASNAKTSLCLLELGSGGKASPIHQAIPITVAAVSQQQQHYHSLQQQQQQQQRMMLQQHMKHQAEMAFRKSSSSINSGVNLNFDSSSCTPTMSSTRSFISSLSIDASVANMDGSATAAFHLIGAPRSSDQNSQNKRKCSAKGDDGSMKCSASGRCHCSKKRKHRVKRSIKVPAISNKLADIPPDDYSWRKYGQKPIKGSPHPRGYYKCSSMRGCPARKHVERCLEESSMLIVTYEGEHNHPRAPSQSATNT